MEKYQHCSTIEETVSLLELKVKNPKHKHSGRSSEFSHLSIFLENSLNEGREDLILYRFGLSKYKNYLIQIYLLKS
jgi:hypothetical protein